MNGSQPEKAIARKKWQLCAVKGCINSSRLTMTYRNDKNVNLHKFPRNEFKRLQWANAIGKPETMDCKYKYVCSLHFSDDSKIKSKLFNHLLPNAIPTIFPKVDFVEMEKERLKIQRNIKMQSLAQKFDCNLDNGDFISNNNNNNNSSNTLCDSDFINTDFGTELGEIVPSDMSLEPSTPRSLLPQNLPQSDGNQIDYSESWENTFDLVDCENQQYMQTPPKISKSQHYHPSCSPPKYEVAKNLKQNTVQIDDPVWISLNGLTNQQDQQVQFSLVSFAPIEVDQTSSFAAPADDEVQELPQMLGEILNVNTAPKNATMESNVAMGVLEKYIEKMENELKNEKEKVSYFKRKYMYADNVNKKYKKKIIEMTDTIVKLKKKANMPVFYLKDKNIKLTFS